MRIIAGEWKGRRIKAPAGRQVRPTADRVREAWMSILQTALPGARVADLFAGTGALGLEALSRGAEHVDFVESSGRTIQVLKENIALLDAEDRCAIHRSDVERYLSGLPTLDSRPPFAVAFADPPYRKGLSAAVAERWLQEPFAAILGVEHESRESMPAGGDTRKYGDSAITVYRLGS